jgi:hypothetical protein
VKITPVDPPREYTAGRSAVVIRDCGRVALAVNEQITFVTERGGEYDVARTSWGFYATPSLNGRLGAFGMRAALVKNPDGKFFVLLVEIVNQQAFDESLAAEGHTVVAWLDDASTLTAIERATRPGDARA